MNFQLSSEGMMYSRKKAILTIAISTLLVSGSVATFLLFFRLQEVFHQKNEAYNIQKIVQTGVQYEALKTLFLAEILELSSDHPTNIFDFDVQEGANKLLSTHVIEKVDIKKVKPATLYIDYEVRSPLAHLGELSNTLVDREGVLFPEHPFYSPKKIPTLYLGGKELRWGEKIDSTKLSLANAILETLNGLHVTLVDLSLADAKTLGTREIVVMVQHKKALHTLRLPTERWAEALHHYTLLVKSVLSTSPQSTIIDLRLVDMAFLGNEA